MRWGEIRDGEEGRRIGRDKAPTRSGEERVDRNPREIQDGRTKRSRRVVSPRERR